MESGKVETGNTIIDNSNILSGDLNTVNLDGQIENVKSVESKMASGSMNKINGAAATNSTANFG